MAKQKITDIVIDALEDIKARDIRVLNVSKITSVSDHIAIASGDSNRQTRALAKHVADKVRAAGYQIYGTEGEDTGEWVLVDCGDIVVHIMQPAVREYYKLEELWAEGKLEFPKPKREPTAQARVTSPDDAVAAANEEQVPKRVATKRTVAKKSAVKKPSARKTPAESSTGGLKAATKSAVTAANKSPAKPAAKKAAGPLTKEPSTTETVAKKPAARKAATKKPAAKKLATKEPAAKDVATKKSAAPKATVKKPAAAKVTTKKVAAKKTTAKKTTAKKTTAKKPAAKKVAAKKTAG